MGYLQPHGWWVWRGGRGERGFWSESIPGCWAEALKSPGSGCRIPGSWWWLGLAKCAHTRVCDTSGTFSCCLTQSTPYGVPHQASWLGKSRLASRFSCHPMVSMDVLETLRIQRQSSLGTVLFSLLPACHGDLLVHLCTGAEKGRTWTAQMEQCSIYLLSYSPLSQSQDLESLSSN